MRKKWVLWIGIIAFLYVAQTLILPIAMGAILAIVFRPGFRFLVDKKIKPVLSSAIVTISFTLLFLIPLAVLSFMGVRGLIKKIPELKLISSQEVGQSIVNSPLIQKIQTLMQRYFSIEPNALVNSLQDYAETVASWIAFHVGDLFTSVPQISLAFAFTLIGLFFFLLEGERIKGTVFSLGIIPDDEMSLLFQRVAAISRALIVASLAIAVIQSLMYSIGCVAVGVSNIVIVGFLVFFMSFVPVVGAVPITFGVAIYYFYFQGPYPGAVLLITAILASTTDNIIRPWFLRGEANLHPLLAFLGVFGGIQTMGIFGIFLGPIVAGIFATSVELLSQRR